MRPPLVRVVAGLAMSGLFMAAAASLPAHAAGQSTVTVKSTRDPVDKSYRKMIRGMERFERERAFAPNASLRFQLLPRLPNVDMRGITLRVAGDTVSVPVPVDDNNFFVLPRNAQALQEDAAVLASRKTASMTWRARIETPGVPAGMRRLGDLRLECRVGKEAGLVSNSSPLFGWISDALDSPEGVCTSPDGNYLFFAERPIFAVTLRAGERVETLPFSMLYAGGDQTPDMLPFCDCQVLLDRTYYVPLWDASWPDDTLVEFTYMVDEPVGVTP
jgi:hypothetical protein